MGKSGFDVSGLRTFQKELEKLRGQVEFIAEDCAESLAGQLLSEVVKRTPVGVYNGSSYTCESGVGHKGSKQSGKMGGTLQKGWKAAPIARTHKDGSVKAVIYNPVKYASDVEYGHVVSGGKGFVQGHFMLEKSRQAVEKIAPKVVRDKLNRFLGGALK